MFSLFHRAISATGFLFLATFPITAFLVLFLTAMSTDSGENGAVYVASILPLVHIFITLFLYGAILLLQHLYKDGIKKEPIQRFWREHSVMILFVIAFLMAFGGQPILFVGGAIAFVYWLTEKMKRWHGLLLILFSLIPYIGFLIWYLLVSNWG